MIPQAAIRDPRATGRSRPTARDVLDADGWFDWDAAGDIVFTGAVADGDHLRNVSPATREALAAIVGVRLRDVSDGQRRAIANLAGVPESVRDLLDNYQAPAQSVKFTPEERREKFNRYRETKCPTN